MYPVKGRFAAFLLPRKLHPEMYAWIWIASTWRWRRTPRAFLFITANYAAFE
jgi:hypothetical protein